MQEKIEAFDEAIRSNIDKDQEQKYYHNVQVLTMYDPDIELRSDDVYLGSISEGPPDTDDFSASEEYNQYI